jgi:hypothetical protein
MAEFLEKNKRNAVVICTIHRNSAGMVEYEALIIEIKSIIIKGR